MSRNSELPPAYTGADRRAHPRTAIRNELVYDYYSSDGNRLGTGRGLAINVGVGGMLVETDMTLEPSTSVLIEMVTPLYTFMATGYVVYAHEAEDGRFRLGLCLQQVIQGSWEPLLAGAHEP